MDESTSAYPRHPCRCIGASLIFADTTPWVAIVVSAIGAGVPVVGAVLMLQLKSAKTQAAADAELIRLDSVKYANRQTLEHNTVANLIREGLKNDAEFEKQLLAIGEDTHQTRRDLREHINSQNPHPTAKAI